jgi:hypothetical protein
MMDYIPPITHSSLHRDNPYLSHPCNSPLSPLLIRAIQPIYPIELYGYLSNRRYAILPMSHSTVIPNHRNALSLGR